MSSLGLSVFKAQVEEKKLRENGHEQLSSEYRQEGAEVMLTFLRRPGKGHNAQAGRVRPSLHFLLCGEEVVTAAHRPRWGHSN